MEVIFRSTSDLILILLDTIRLGTVIQSSDGTISFLAKRLAQLQKAVVDQFEKGNPMVQKRDPQAGLEGQEEFASGISPWVISSGREPRSDPMSAPSWGPMKRSNSIFATRDLAESVEEDDQCAEIRSVLERREILSMGRSSSTDAIASKSTIKTGEIILTILLDVIEGKLQKVKWTRDLVEFVTEQNLDSQEFEPIRLLMDQLIITLDEGSIRYVASSAQRPCWAIVSMHIYVRITLNTQ